VLGIPRFITNPAVHLREPMRFGRESVAEFSPIERAILRGLGVDRLDWHITGQRKHWLSDYDAGSQKAREQEQARMAKAARP